MGIAALVLGIISIIIAFVPFCGIIAFLPALVGLIFGIVDLVLKNRQQKSKGISITGVILSSVSIVIMVFWFFVFGMVLSSGGVQKEFEKIGDEMQKQMEKETNILNSIDNDLYDF